MIFATWEVALGPYQKGLFKYKACKKEFTSTVLLFSNILTIFLFSLIAIFHNQFLAFTGISTGLTITMFISVLFQPAYQCWMTQKKTDFDYKKSVTMTFLIAIIQIIFPLIAILVFSKTAEIKYMFTILPAALVFMIFYFKEFHPFYALKNKPLVKDQIKFLVSFTAPLVLHSLSFYLLGQSDRVMIGKMVGNEAVAIYSVAYTVSNIAVIIQNSALQVIAPWTFRCMEDEKYEEIGQKMLFITMGISVIYILFILVAPEVIFLLFPKEYHEGIWCIPPISIGIFFTFMYSLFVNIESYLENTKFIAYVTLVCAGINLALNYIGISKFGYIACAYTTLICYVLFSIGHYYFMTKLLKEKYAGQKIYDGKKFAALGFFMIAFLALEIVAYKFLYFRYITIIAIIIALFVFGRKNIKFIEEIMRKEQGKKNEL